MKLSWVIVVMAVSSVALADSEQDWHKKMEAYFNGTGDDTFGNNLSEQHKKLADQCGHPLEVKIEWKGFDMKTWTSTYTNLSVCAGNRQIVDIAEACASDSPLSASQRAKVKKIKTLTCHYKPCTKLPDPPSGGKGSNAKATEFQYKLTKKGTNLDETFCENSANMGNDALDVFLRKL